MFGVDWWLILQWAGVAVMLGVAAYIKAKLHIRATRRGKKDGFAE